MFELPTYVGAELSKKVEELVAAGFEVNVMFTLDYDGVFLATADGPNQKPFTYGYRIVGEIIGDNAWLHLRPHSVRRCQLRGEDLDRLVQEAVERLNQ